MATPPGSYKAAVFNFIQQPAIAGAGPYRNLNQYYEEKKTNVGLLSPTGRQDMKDMLDGAFAACGIANHQNPNVLLAGPVNELRLLATATVVAMAIIKVPPVASLQGHYDRLMRSGKLAVRNELRQLVTHGDSIQSARNNRLTFKNFTSAGTQKTRRIAEAEEAYQRSYDLLTTCRQKFILVQGALSPVVNAAFLTYFGNPAALIDTSTIPWLPAIAGGSAPPNWAPVNQTVRTVVREVLRRCCDVHLSLQNVQISLGGKYFGPGTYAYVKGTQNPTVIHVGHEFFGLGIAGLDTRGGTIVHELTHTWARTADHVYGLAGTQALVTGGTIDQAVSNADNYTFFVEAAFAP